MTKYQKIGAKAPASLAGGTLEPNQNVVTVELASKIVGLRAPSGEPAPAVPMQRGGTLRRDADAPQPAAPPGTAGVRSPPAASGMVTKRNILVGIAALVALVVAYEGYVYVVSGRYMISTDDAYVRVDMTTLAAKASGYVKSINVKDNSLVKVGDVLLTLDDGDYALAVDAAKGRLATQAATIDRLAQQGLAQKAAVDQARAQVNSVKAEVARADAEFARTSTLASSRISTVKSLDQARSDQAKAKAAVVSAEAAVAAAEANLGVAAAQKIEAQRTADELRTALAKAERDLSYATIRAPVSGIVGNRVVQIGDYVQPGSRVLAIVPIDSAYAEANFKETQLRAMKPGQTATVTVDAIGGTKYKAVVESLAPASGSQFSLLPPENATGNFTKIVQRVPVRIKLPAEAIASGALRTGLSVVVDVDTKPPAAVPIEVTKAKTP